MMTQPTHLSVGGMTACGLRGVAHRPIKATRATAQVSCHRCLASLKPERPTIERYGTREHEDWLIEQEERDVADERPDQPWTPCGCTSRAYGGDCAHTVESEYNEGSHPPVTPEQGEPNG